MARSQKNKLTPSQEDYLEAILFLVGEARVARVRDIARRLGVGMSSVTAALKALSKRKLVNYDPYEVVTLTGKGEELAREITRRHEALRKFFTDMLDLDPGTADEKACLIEHHIDEVVVRRLGYLAEFVGQSRDSGGDQWMADFMGFCEERERSQGVLGEKDITGAGKSRRRGKASK